MTGNSGAASRTVSIIWVYLYEPPPARAGSCNGGLNYEQSSNSHRRYMFRAFGFRYRPWSGKSRGPRPCLLGGSAASLNTVVGSVQSLDDYPEIKAWVKQVEYAAGVGAQVSIQVFKIPGGKLDCVRVTCTMKPEEK